MFSEGRKVFLKEPADGHTEAGLQWHPAGRAVPARMALGKNKFFKHLFMPLVNL